MPIIVTMGSFPAEEYPRMSVSENGERLTVRNVCRDCEDGSTDLRVIQCEANAPGGRTSTGVAYTQGYLNVLRESIVADCLQHIHSAKYNGSGLSILLLM